MSDQFNDAFRWHGREQCVDVVNHEHVEQHLRDLHFQILVCDSELLDEQAERVMGDTPVDHTAKTKADKPLGTKFGHIAVFDCWDDQIRQESEEDRVLLQWRVDSLEKADADEQAPEINVGCQGCRFGVFWVDAFPNRSSRTA